MLKHEANKHQQTVFTIYEGLNYGNLFLQKALSTGSLIYGKLCLQGALSTESFAFRKLYLQRVKSK